MKKLINTVTVIKDGKATITGDVIEAQPHEFRFPVQQASVGYLNEANMRWPRHLQISNEAFFIKAFGNGLAIPADEMVKIASILEPKTTFPPVVNKISTDLEVDLASELDPDFQWQVSDKVDKDADWKNIEGETKKNLDKSKVKSGQFVRLIISSEAGSVTSNFVLVK
jgi:hypothetical protein